MIVVLGRPGLDEKGGVAGTAGLIALAARGAGGSVELVGSVRDDSTGDSVVVELGRAGIRHAAVLRDPTGTDVPRLEAADIELGLRYLAECQVLIVAEQLPEDALAVAMDAASYHRAALIVLTPAAAPPPGGLPDEATVLELPDEDGGAFAALVGRYAAHLDAGKTPADSWRSALEEGGWEHAAE